jgi:hypothetical protein
MKSADHAAPRSYLSVRSSDRLITVGYAGFAVVAIIVLYFACGGPGLTEAELTIATLLP